MFSLITPDQKIPFGTAPLCTAYWDFFIIGIFNFYGKA